MRSHVRIPLLAAIAAATLGASLPATAQAVFGIQKFFAGNCKAEFEKCGEGAKSPGVPEAEHEGYRQAGGFVPFGITDFRLNSTEIKNPVPPLPPQFEKAFNPIGNVKNIRVDVAPGFVTNPEAVPKCSMAAFKGTEIPGQGVFTEPNCPAGSWIGKNVVTTIIMDPELGGAPINIQLEGKVYNLEQPPGLASDFGVALNLEPVEKAPVFAHTFIQGNVEWGTDYHDYFVIKEVSKALPLLESRLVFYGNVSEVEFEHKKEKRTPSTFLRNPSVCSVPGSQTTTTLRVEPYVKEAGETPLKPEVSPVGTNNCLAQPFGQFGNVGTVGPAFGLASETTASDTPNGITAEASVNHPASEIDTSDLKDATFTLPEGMTMNPSAAQGLTACPANQFKIGIANPIAFAIPPLALPNCPPGSEIGQVSLEVPTLPAGSLKGPIYLGTGAPGEPITGPPYTIYFVAASTQPGKEFGVQVVLKGTVTPNPVTGQLTTTFAANPQAPFDNVRLHFNGGPFAPIANPLVCGAAPMAQAYTGWGGLAFTAMTLFTTTGCPSPSFKWGQTTSTVPSAGQPDSFFIFKLFRSDGQQYLSQSRTELPKGLDAKIPAVPLCPEPQANAEAGCSAENQIGTATVQAGAGPQPFTFSGPVYLTGPYAGAPYGLSIKVPAVAGPFNFGTVVTRSKIEVDPYSGRVILTTNVPTIRQGVPLRLRSINVLVSRPNYLLAPTGCEQRPAESTLISTLGAKESVSNPFEAAGCQTLAFKPSFKAASSARTSKANGAELETTVNQTIGQANIKSVLVQLPAQLPSRLTTLQKACLAATFEKNPGSCPAGSFVGGARANTPTLPGKLQGPAILVSHGGEAFPDLDLVMEANGVRVILVGHTDIKKAITTTNFSTTPDAPVSSITVNLPRGPHSALTANGNLCAKPLIMPTTITGQNGKKIKQNTRINVRHCPRNRRP